MFEYFRDLTVLQTNFFYIGLGSLILFIIQSLFTFLDLGAHFEFDPNFDGHIELNFFQSFGLPFNLFTIRGIIGFFVLFGWTGLAVSKAGLPLWATFIIAFLAGFGMMVVVGLIYFLVEKLTENGNLEMSHAIGKEGEVYIPIPGFNGGTGKVSIILNDSLRELDAVTEKEDLKSGDFVKVVQVMNDKLVVEKIDDK